MNRDFSLKPGFNSKPRREENLHRKLATASGLLAVYLLTTSCSGAGTGFMDPAGPIAGTERTMFFEIAAVTLIVVIPVFVLVPWVLWRYRRSGDPIDYAPEWESANRLEWAIWAVPVLIVAALSVFVWQRTHQLDPYRELTHPGEPVEIQVVALDWKWLFIYPEKGVASVNEMVIPEGRPINLKLTSGTVMQSFHVPKLAGQVYAMAGMTTELSLSADRAGTFRGRNTQYNGDGFAQQHFDVIAMPSDRFDSWIASRRAAGAKLDPQSFLLLAAPSVETEPTYYGRVDENMFATILKLSTRANGALGASPRHRDEDARP